MILNPFRVLNGVCIAHPGLSPGATDVEPLSGFIALNCMSNMGSPNLTHMPLRVLDDVCIVYPELSPGATDVEPLSGIIALNCVSNMLSPELSRIPKGVEINV